MAGVSVREAVQQFLEFARETVSPATWRLYALYLRRFDAKCGDLPIDSLTPSMVRTWGKSYHPVQAVQRLTAWAKHEARLIDANPLERMRKIPRGRRLRILAPPESAAMLRRSGRDFRRLLLALRESIARPAEVRRVTWADLRTTALQPFTPADLREGRAFFFLDGAKADDRRDDRYAVRVIPVSKRLGRLLARLWERADERAGTIFLNRLRKPWTVNAVRCRMRRLRQRAGVGCDHRGENVVAYSLRHTGATKAIVAGVDLATLAAVMGHADVRMTSRYVHLCPDHLAKALGRVTEVKTRFAEKSERPGSRRNASDGAR